MNVKYLYAWREFCTKIYDSHIFSVSLQTSTFRNNIDEILHISKYKMQSRNNKYNSFILDFVFINRSKIYRLRL